VIALIPARAGSKRIPGKNTRLFFGHPLLAYAIHGALESGIFGTVCVCTDDEAACQMAESYGASWWKRAPSGDDEADIAWLTHAPLRPHETFAILRPTSPFRTAETIRRAYQQFLTPDSTADAIRAVEPVSQHPGKMWEWAGRGYPITPLLSGKRSDGVPWHSCPTQTLPTFYVQNACLEMGYTANVETHGTIHGRKVAPFFTIGHEGCDLNTERDWRDAEFLVTSGHVALPDPTAALAAAPPAFR
jgi:CMP-N,N'-diacetyllegionaminic acid synthase